MQFSTLKAAPALLLMLLLGLPCTASAFDLTGTWDFTFVLPTGTVQTDTCNLRQIGDDLVGAVLYQQGGETLAEPIKGTVDQAGKVEFVLTDAGLKIPHTGTIFEGGDTVKGEYIFDNKSWMFEMHRK